MRQLFATAFVLSLSGCHSEPAPPAAHAEQTAVATTSAEPAAPTGSAESSEKAEFGPHRAPVVVHLKGPEQVAAGQDITLVAQIEQRTGDSAPVTLNLQLPEGVHLVEGSANETLPAGNGALERRFVVHVDAMPIGDVELIAHTRGAGFGAHAKGAYHFGRGEQRLPEPPRTRQDTVVGSKNLGPAIDLSKNAQKH
jgi:hypothetical protein